MAAVAAYGQNRCDESEGLSLPRPAARRGERRQVVTHVLPSAGEADDWMVAMNYLSKESGAGEWTRTIDLLITNQLLYQLSYTGLERNPNRSIGLRPDRPHGRLPLEEYQTSAAGNIQRAIAGNFASIRRTVEQTPGISLNRERWRSASGLPR